MQILGETNYPEYDNCKGHDYPYWPHAGHVSSKTVRNIFLENKIKLFLVSRVFQKPLYRRIIHGISAFWRCFFLLLMWEHASSGYFSPESGNIALLCVHPSCCWNDEAIMLWEERPILRRASSDDFYQGF